MNDLQPMVVSALIDAKLAQLPARPGVYRMFDAESRLLYVGKAKNLRNRVRSYFRGRPLDGKTMAMVGRIADLDITLTPSDDGGYVLIGLNRVHAAPFTDIAWSTPQVLAQSQRACQHHGLSLTLNPSLWDIDDGADLQRLRALQKFDSLVAECP